MVVARNPEDGWGENRKMETLSVRSPGLKVQEASCSGTLLPPRTFDPVPSCHKSGSQAASAPSAFNRPPRCGAAKKQPRGCRELGQEQGR